MEEIKMCDNGMNDAVKEPNHYQQGTFEVIDEMIIAFGPQKTFDFCIMNAWKYRARAPFKNNTEQDMKKANRYLEMARCIQKLNPSVTNYNTPRLIRAIDK